MVMVKVFFVFFCLFLLQLLSSQLCLWKHSWSGGQWGLLKCRTWCKFEGKGDSAHIRRSAVLLLQRTWCTPSRWCTEHHSQNCFFKHTCHLHQHLKKTSAQFPIKAPVHSLAFRVKRIFTCMMTNIAEFIVFQVKSALGGTASIEWTVICSTLP